MRNLSTLVIIAERGGWENGRVITHTYDLVDQYNVEVQASNCGGNSNGRMIVPVGADSLGVILEFDHNETADLGESKTYTHILHNIGVISDTYGITAVSSRNWPVLLSGNIFTLPEQSQVTLLVTVTVPGGPPP